MHSLTKHFSLNLHSQIHIPGESHVLPEKLNHVKGYLVIIYHYFH